MFAETITSFVFGLIISWQEYLPTILSLSETVSFPSELNIAFTIVPWSEWQSTSLTITSWETSTSLLVKYPESAVFNAVSAPPFLAPWVPVKNSLTLSPSRKQDLTGISIVSPLVELIKPLIPISCAKLESLPLAPDFHIMQSGFLISVPSIFLTSSFILSLAFFHTSQIWLCLSSSERKPSSYKLAILSFKASACLIIFSLPGITLISLKATVKPLVVEYL